MPLITTVTLRVRAELSKVIGGITAVVAPEVVLGEKMASGVGLDQADKLYYAKPVIGGSATLTLDLAGGGLVDIYGDAVALARLKLILLKSDLALCPNPIKLQRPATNGVPLFDAVSDALAVRPGGGVIWWAPDATGVAVTAGTGDLIDIVNTAAGNVQPEILIVGASA